MNVSPSNKHAVTPVKLLANCDVYAEELSE